MDVDGDPSLIGQDEKRQHNISLPFEMISFMEDKLEEFNELQQIKNLEQYETIEDFVASRDFLGSTGYEQMNRILHCQ